MSSSKPARRVGVMGGTFDPIHVGHLVTADEAMHHFSLDEVVFVPAGDPWQKQDRQVASGNDRFEMTRIATESHPGFSVSRIELDRSGPTFTLDTLREMHQSEPDCELVFITGADAILQIFTWKDPEQLFAEAKFVAATRPGYDLSVLDGALAADEGRVEVFEIPALAISSTDIRERARKGLPINYLVPDGVAAHINKVGLYRS